MFSFKPDPFSLAFFTSILDNKMMHQHHPIDGIVRNGESIARLNDLFEDNRSGFVDLIRIQDDPFELRVQGFLLPSGIFQFWDESGIRILFASIGRSVAVKLSQTGLYRPGVSPSQVHGLSTGLFYWLISSQGLLKVL